MSRNSGSVAPKERINIKYVSATRDEQAEVELPHKMLVLGDFGLDDSRALEDRSVMRIDKHTFNNVLHDADVSLAMSVPSCSAPQPIASWRSTCSSGQSRISAQIRLSGRYQSSTNYCSCVKHWSP